MYQNLIYAPVPAHQANQESFNNESFPDMMIVNPQQQVLQQPNSYRAPNAAFPQFAP